MVGVHCVVTRLSNVALFFIFFAGFTVGDELGFAQSLSITDANKRRSVAGRSATGASVKTAVRYENFDTLITVYILKNHF